MRSLSSLLSLLVLSACASPVRLLRRGGEERPELPRDVRVLVAPPQWVDLHEQLAAEAAFVRGCSVGHLAQQGGFRFDEALRTTRSSQVEAHDVERYRGQMADAVASALAGLGRTRGWSVLPFAMPEGALGAAFSVEAGPVEPTDGKDNGHVTPLRLRWAALSPLDGADLLVVPVVVHAYSHNSGWFPGQQWGCRAGARVRAVIGVYDARSGRVLFDRDLDASLIAEEAPLHPDRFQAEALYLKVVGAWKAALEQQTFR